MRSPGGKRGQPTKLTPERQKLICDLLRAGNYRTTAVEAAGIHYSTFLGWLDRGQEALDLDESDIYSEFLESVTLAEHEGLAQLVVTIRKHAETDWHAAKYILSMRRPDEWAQTQRIEATVEHHDGDSKLDDEIDAMLDEMTENETKTQRLGDVADAEESGVSGSSTVA